MNNEKQSRLPFGIGMLIVLGFYISMGALHIDPVSSSLPRIAEELGNSVNGAIVVSSAYFLGNMLGYVFSGPLADIIGRKKTALIGMLFTISGAIVCFFAASLHILSMGRFIMGCGASAALCTGRAIGGDAGEGRSSARALSIMQIISGCLAVIMPMVGNAITHGSNWRYAFLFMLCVDFCLIISTVLLVKETYTGERAGAWRRLAKNAALCIKKPVFICFVFAFAMGISTFYCYVSAASFVFQNNLGMMPTPYAELYALLGAMMVCGAFLASLLTKKAHVSHVFLAVIGIQFFTAIAVSLLFLTGLASIASTAVCFGIITFSSAIVIPLGMSLSLSEAGEVKGSTAAVCGIVQSVMSWLFSTLLSRIEGTGIGFATGFIMCVTTLIAFACGFIGVKMQNREKKHNGLQ